MTDKEKQELRQQFHEVADKQADILIKTISSIDKQFPKDITKEQRDEYLQQIIQASTTSLHDSTKALGEEMLKQAKEFKMEGTYV